MKFRLLIVDDELEESARSGPRKRREIYQLLAGEFDLLFLEKPGDLVETLKTANIQAVLMDFVLARWSVDAGLMLQMVNNRCPVFLISSNWGPNFDRLRQALGTHTIAQIFTWEELEQAERRHLIRLWIEAEINKRYKFSTMDLEADEAIRILQLSDMHFGSKAPEAFAAETERAAQAVFRRWNAPPHLIALTGDLSHRGLPSEYDLALEWLNAFAKKLDPNWTEERFLLIPGNHDVCWPLGWSSHIEIGSSPSNSSLDVTGKLGASELRPYAFAPFRQFARELLKSDQWSGKHQFWTSGVYRHLGLVLFGYNTCENLNEWSVPTKTVSDRSMASMIAEVRNLKSDAPDAIVVGLMHHPLTSSDPTEVIQNQDVFLKNLDEGLGSIVTLSGHVHANLCTLQDRSGVSFLEVTASTTRELAVHRGEDTLRGFNMIEITRKKGRVVGLNVCACKFEALKLSMVEEARYARNAAGRLTVARSTASKK
ncbi:metallophosphoesterase family protein [Bradyrhizobium sp. HKCCYLS2038]|uniref:metallophosphoesterase family protein n=1 Tax=unclassified Bradyrhizobium TaxID=2631580 RepID=UPI003EB966D3